MSSSTVPCKSPTDWSRCCLCQTDKKNECPKSQPTNYSCSIEQDGYSVITKNLPLFQAINALPIILDPARLDEGDGMDETLRMRQTKYHRSCRISLNNTKLERAYIQKIIMLLQVRFAANCEEALKIKYMFASYAKKKTQHPK